MIKVAFTGGRNFSNGWEFYQFASSFLNPEVHSILVGDATGLDEMVRVYVERYNKDRDAVADNAKFKIEVFKADWATHGKAAGPIRNRAMLQTANVLVAFEGGKGTANCIETAKNLWIPVVRVGV